jgi:pimeloyl-ACP methyl ester carboxylesterase
MKVAEMIRQTCRLDPSRDYNLELIDGHIWVFFHASWTNQDWLRDFLLFPKHLGEKTWGHLGYFSEAMDVLETLEKDLSGYKEITFVGYSRGAAVALLLAPIFNVKKVYLMGCPRTFWKLNPIYFEGINVIELVYGKDLVTFLPPFFPKIKWNNTITFKSESTGWFKSIKDHAGYLDVQDDV